jgi:alpha-tubulin suppressor-like RCC1 family protein
MNELWMLIRRWAVACLAVGLAACHSSSGPQDPAPGAPPAAVAPQITTAPQAATVVAGQTAQFGVQASGTAPLSYQWLRDGQDIAGATGATLTLAAVGLVDNGAAISVQVSNAAGSVRSAAVPLTVHPLVTISITMPPAAVGASVGGTASFGVAVSVTPTGTPASYQWLRDGAELAGATAATYTTPPLVLADDGARFSVRVSAGNATPVLSAEALLTVSAAPASSTPSISAGLGFGLAVHRDGGVLLLGSSTLLDRIAGSAVAGTGARRITGLDAVAVSAGRDTGLAVGRDGRLRGFGIATGGNLGGNLVNGNIDAPQEMAGVDGVIGALASGTYSLALRSDGSVWHWPGTLSFAPQQSMPREIAGLTQVQRLVQGPTGSATGKTQPLAIRGDGTVWSLAWTASTGVNVQTHIGSATRLGTLAHVDDLSCTGHCLALLRDGTVLAWGRNAEGQLGPAAGSVFTLPVAQAVTVPGLVDVLAVAATAQASVAITRDGRVWSWGGTYYHGQGSAGAVVQPTVISGLSDAVAVSADDRLVYVLLADGSLWGFGANGQGELGDGSRTERLRPVRATGLSLR